MDLVCPKDTLKIQAADLHNVPCAGARTKARRGEGAGARSAGSWRRAAAGAEP